MGIRKISGRTRDHSQDHPDDRRWSVRRFRAGTSNGPAYVEFAFPTKEGHLNHIQIPYSELRHRKRLLDRFADHLPIFPNSVGPTDACRSKFINDLVDSCHSPIEIMPDRTGFIEKGKFATFAEIICSDGTRTPVQRIGDSNGSKFTDVCGNLDATRRDILDLGRYSSYLTFAVGAALATCLPSYLHLRRDENADLDGVGIETAVFNFSGRSSSGKTSICLAAVSLAGSPKRIGTMNFSERGLAELAADSHDLLMGLDDSESADHETGLLVRALKAIVHTVPGGRSKIISRGIDQTKFPLLRWSRMALTGGPRHILELAAERDWHLSPGDKVRAFNIKVPSSKKGGIFDRLHGSSSERARQSIDLIARLERGYSNNHGQIIPVWVTFLMRKDRSGQIINLVKKFTDQVGATRDGWEKRFARKFGLVYAAIILGIKANLLPWSKNLALSAVTKCYRRARKSAMTEPEAIQDGARRLSRLLNRDGKTIHVRPGDKPTFLPETCFAIRYAKEGQAMIGVFDETLNRLFPSRKAKTTFTKALIKVGAIQNGHGHAGTVQERLPVVIRGETIDRPRFWPFDAGQFIALCARA